MYKFCELAFCINCENQSYEQLSDVEKKKVIINRGSGQSHTKFRHFNYHIIMLMCCVLIKP